MSSRIKVIYIAGPFRGPNAWAIAENVRHAERWGLLVAQAGMMPLIPHANTALFHGQLTDQFWLDGTLELLRRCDGLVMIPGAQKSSGARAEATEARRLGLVVADLSEMPPYGLPTISVLRQALGMPKPRGEAEPPDTVHPDGFGGEDYPTFTRGEGEP